MRDPEPLEDETANTHQTPDEDREHDTGTKSSTDVDARRHQSTHLHRKQRHSAEYSHSRVLTERMKHCLKEVSPAPVDDTLETPRCPSLIPTTTATNC